MMMVREADHPHQHMPLMSAGAVMIMLHGRGATAGDILLLADELQGNGVHYVAPQAVGNSWYPFRFMESIEKNQPWLSSALKVLDAIVRNVRDNGIPPEKIILLGFSQGACLALEYAVRHARRYGGLAALSGGLIGPPGTSWNYGGSLAGTPVFLGCDEEDYHIPRERVLESTGAMKGMGAEVSMQLYRNMGHTINRDEIKQVQVILDTVTGNGRNQ